MIALHQLISIVLHSTNQTKQQFSMKSCGAEAIFLKILRGWGWYSTTLVYYLRKLKHEKLQVSLFSTFCYPFFIFQIIFLIAHTDYISRMISLKISGADRNSWVGNFVKFPQIIFRGKDENPGHINGAKSNLLKINLEIIIEILVGFHHLAVLLTVLCNTNM